MFPSDAVLVAVSEFERKIILDTWGPSIGPERVCTLLSTTGHLECRTAPPVLPYTVLTASWLEYYKQPLLWIEVAAEVIRRVGRDRVCFMWLGEGSMLEECRLRASSIDGVVLFPGVVSDVSPYYESAWAYLQLSSVENMSLSVLDAQRYGVPSIVTDVGGLPEIVRGGGIVLVEDDVATIAEQIVSLLDAPERWDSYAAAACEEYEERHSPQEWHRRMVALHIGR
jgi:glycosyltransferase involved in cell wall biosynthesis